MQKLKIFLSEEKNKLMRFYLTILFLLFSVVLFNLNAAETGLILTKISENFDEYKDKEIIINLRLRNIDNVFQNIIFYDLKNCDISFDFSNNKAVKKMLKSNPLLHNGLVYKVKMIPRSLDAFFSIKADLLDYEPLFLEKLPYGKAE